jgi:hypothetical protein
MVREAIFSVSYEWASSFPREEAFVILDLLIAKKA